MSTTGNIDLWAAQFPTEDISSVLILVLSSWQTFKFTCKRLEVPITQRFCAHLLNNKQRSIHLFRVAWESYELADDGRVMGRIDLKFSQGLDETVYFSIECKLLRVRRKNRTQSLAGKYVTEGMSRYFNGQYARDLDKGGMLGYVMDGNYNEAIKDVQKAVEKRRFDLYMQENETLNTSSLILSQQVRESLHRYGPNQPFTIYHIFLPLNAISNNN